MDSTSGDRQDTDINTAQQEAADCISHASSSHGGGSGICEDTCRAADEAGSSSGGLLPNTFLHIHHHLQYLAGSEAASSASWGDSGPQQSVDCAVEVQVVVQRGQTPVKTEPSSSPQQQQQQQQPQPQPPQRPPLLPAAVRRQRGKIRCCAITLLVLGLLATGVLVPVAVTVGFKQDIAPEYRVLQPPAASHRLLFAFEGLSLAAAPQDVLPPDIARQVTDWATLPSSGIHIASFSEAQAMQQALDHLKTPPAEQPPTTRRRLQDDSATTTTTSSSSRSHVGAGWTLKYAVSDFQLVPQHTVTRVVDPMQLFDLARQQGRSVLQADAMHGASAQPRASASSRSYYSAAEGDEEDTYLWNLQQQQSLNQQQSQRTRAVRAAAAAARNVPSTGLQRQGEQQHSRRRQLAGADAVVMPNQQGAVAAAEILPVMVQTSRHVGGTMVASTQPAAAVDTALLTRSGQTNLGPSSSTASSTGSLWSSVLRRVLLQGAAEAGPVPSFRQQLQPQQKQAQQQVQRGGSKVAWHLADSGLGVREAWNITSGLDRVIVAVIDSGVELASGGVGASLWSNAAEVAGDGIDNDGNGYIDDAMGWDFGGACGDIACSFCTPGPDPTDTVGWGTHTASAIAAQPEVASGTAGIAPGVRIMPLKVADCRHGTQLWDVATQQGSLVSKQLDDDATGSSSSDTNNTGSSSSNSSVSASSSSSSLLSGQAVRSQQGLGPTLLGSAAVQALDYALLNGAHIVVAGWSAGDLVAGSSSGGDTARQCFMGTEAAADAAGCAAGVQRLLFLDALRPLQQAGVLVVTMEDTSSSSSRTSGSDAASAAAAPLPCSLSCDLDNVLCVSASTTLLPPAGSEGGLSDVASAADFFAPLINQHSSSFYNRLGSDAVGSSADEGADSDTAGGDTRSSSTKANLLLLDAARCEARSSTAGSSQLPWAQLGAPGTDIVAGWAWGSHAVVSGGSAAASVTAGVAALAWSKLGQTLGADAAPGVFEGLGQRVKQELLQGSTRTAGGDDGSSGASTLPNKGGVDATDTIAAALPSSTRRDGSLIMGGSASGPVGELDLFGALQQSSSTASSQQDLTMQPAILTTDLTSACRALRYSWHIQADESGPYDTNSMWFVARKALKPAVFPLTRWEFFGATSLVELTGYLEVAATGSYELAAASEDRFVLWLQDVWLHMRPTPQLRPDAWTARVNFTAPGLYKFRLIIYAPSKPFDLQWRTPGSSSHSAITSFVSLGQTQPLPQQLLHNMLLPMSNRADSSSERSDRGTSAQHQPPNTPAAAAPSPPSPQQAAAPPDSDAAAASPVSLPAAPATNQAAGSVNSATDDAKSFATSTRSSSSREYSAGESAPSTSSNAAESYLDDSSSMAATMEPAEAPTGNGLEPELAEDAVRNAAAALGGAGAAGGNVGGWQQDAAGASPDAVQTYAYSPNSGYPLQRNTYYAPAVGPSDVGGGRGEDFWGSLSSFFGGNWFGRRRRLNHRRALLGVGAAAARSAPAMPQKQPPSPPNAPAHTLLSSLQQQQQQQPSQPAPARQLLEAAAATAAAAAAWDGNAAAASTPMGPAQAARTLKQAGAASGSSVWGRFSLALSFVDRTQYRTLMPDLNTVSFTHTGVLPGPGLQVGGWTGLQQSVLGYSGSKDNRGAYGMVQGWLDWQNLNPAAAAAITAAAASTQAAAAASTLLTTGGGRGVATEGAALGSNLGGPGVSVGAAGVQFELSCESCSLQIDGMTVVGSLGQVETSSCIVPAAVAAAAVVADSGDDDLQRQQKSQHLLHLHMLFTTNDIRKTAFAVRSRPCSGINTWDSSSGGGGGGGVSWVPLAAAGSGSPPAFAVSSSVVKQKHSKAGSNTPVFSRGMLCAVHAQPPPSAAAAGAAGGDSSSSVLDRMVFISAEKLQQAITVTVNDTSSSGSGSDTYSSILLASLQPQNLTQLANSSSSGSRKHSLTVDAPTGSSGERGDGSNEAGHATTPSAEGAAAPDMGNSSSNSSYSYNVTAEEEAEAAAEAAARLAELQRRAAQTAAAKAAALARGLTVADLVPDWVDSLPADTQYSFSCGCYWNGSWDGNVTLRVSTAAGTSSSSSGWLSSGSSSGSGGGSARMFLAGWPVAAKQGTVYGPSDLDVRGYSTLMQRQQLAAGSDSADPLTDVAHLWVNGGFGSSGSSSSGSIAAAAASMGGESMVLAGGISRGGGTTPTSSSSSGAPAAKLSASQIRLQRFARLQHAAAHRSSGSTGSGSSALLGLQPIGSIDGVVRHSILPKAGQHQLLVLQADGLTAQEQVVVLAQGDTSRVVAAATTTTATSSSTGGAAAAADGSDSSGDSSSSSGGVTVVSSWLPGPWDAWVPVG